jgi:hypothetical protein
VGEAHFDRSYVNYVRELVPSWSLLGHRYFLSRPVTDRPYGVVFSNHSPWSLERFNLAREGKASREGVLYYEVPSNYDPNAAPKGKQMLMTGSFCPPDPELSEEEIRGWGDAGEEILFGAFPDLEGLIESKERYTARSVSNATRDSVVAGAGGETIGLGQIAGQCGAAKPSIKAPIGGLFYVGCDAGGTGVGTQQAIESGSGSPMRSIATTTFAARRGEGGLRPPPQIVARAPVGRTTCVFIRSSACEKPRASATSCGRCRIGIPSFLPIFEANCGW